MSIRLQVVMDENEIAALRQVAQARKVTVSELVRTTLRDALSTTTEADPQARLDAIHTAAGYRFPAPDIDQMLTEIESGYLADR